MDRSIKSRRETKAPKPTSPESSPYADTPVQKNIMGKSLNYVFSGRKRHDKRIAALKNTAAAEPAIPADNALARTPAGSGGGHVQPPEDAKRILEIVTALPLFQILRCEGKKNDAIRFLRYAFGNIASGAPTPGHLPALTRINALDALIRNAVVIGITAEALESEDDSSPFTCQYQLPPTPGAAAAAAAAARALPPCLAPTTLQRTVAHHPWLDMFPIPDLRDNILRGIQAGVLDEDELCHELTCELLDLNTASKAPLLIWGDSWDLNGWELSPGFFRRWGPLLRGCQDVLQATNHWRQKRGEARIEVILEG